MTRDVGHGLSSVTRTAAPKRRRMRMTALATTMSSSTSTYSSTPWARSIPLVPTITHGIFRARKCCMSAPHGTPASRAGRPSSSVSASRATRLSGWSPGVALGRNVPVQRSAIGGPASSTASLSARWNSVRARSTEGPDRHAEPTRKSQLIWHLPLPFACLQAAYVDRIWKFEPLHQLMLNVRINLALMVEHRLMYWNVAVDRRHTLESCGSVGRSAKYEPFEQQRPGLCTHNVKARRFWDYRAMKRLVPLQRSERA